MRVNPVVFKVHKSLREQLAPDATYLLAVSGGADSMALAAACAELARAGWGRYFVLHVEHGLRAGEALEDMRLVENFCSRQGLPCQVEHVDVQALVSSEHLSTEDAARRLRYEALYRYADAVGANYILTAHHADDQAETVLLKLVRGAGLRGLGAMRRLEGRILRPLLPFTRKDLENYCQTLDIVFCYDSSNDNLQYARNRVRRELLPYLEKCFNRSVKNTLCQTARILQEDADCLDELAMAVYEKVLVGAEANCFELDAVELHTLLPALRKRVLRRAFFLLGGEELSYERTQALEQLTLARTGGKIIQLPGGVEARYSKRKLIFSKVEQR